MKWVRIRDIPRATASFVNLHVFRLFTIHVLTISCMLDSALLLLSALHQLKKQLHPCLRITQMVYDCNLFPDFSSAGMSQTSITSVNGNRKCTTRCSLRPAAVRPAQAILDSSQTISLNGETSHWNDLITWDLCLLLRCSIDEINTALSNDGTEWYRCRPIFSFKSQNSNHPSIILLIVLNCFFPKILVWLQLELFWKILNGVFTFLIVGLTITWMRLWDFYFVYANIVVHIAWTVCLGFHILIETQ